MKRYSPLIVLAVLIYCIYFFLSLNRTPWPEYSELWDTQGCCIDIEEIAKKNIDLRTIAGIKKGEKQRLFLDQNLKLAAVKNMPAYYKAYRLQPEDNTKIRVALKSGLFRGKDFNFFVDSLLYAVDQHGYRLPIDIKSSGFQKPDGLKPHEMVKVFIISPREDTTSVILYVTSDNTNQAESANYLTVGVDVTENEQAHPYYWGWVNIAVD